MRRYSWIVSALIAATPSLLSQTGTLIAGVGGLVQTPLGTLHDRFRPAVGGMVYAGVRISPRWAWTGRIDYVELRRLHTESLAKTVKLQEASGDQVYRLPLEGLTMSLTATCAAAEAQVDLVDLFPLRIQAHGGFGFTYWVFSRGAYRDSLFVTSRVTGQRTLAAVLAVPDSRQTDWSGTLNLGVDVRIRIADPVWITAGGGYRLIIGELWPALDLDLENVSGMQFLSLRAGLMVEF